MTYDCIVSGIGGVGSATLSHLAARGAKVLGIDPFPPGHDRGSSHGHTRMIRLAYFEHPDYVPLLRRAFELWEDLGPGLYRETGVVQIGPPDGVVVPGVERAAREHGLEIEEIERGSVPGLDWPESMRAVFEKRAGLLSVEECVRAHVARAQQHGAELRTGCTLLSWEADGDGVAVETTDGRLRASRLVITPGPWAPSVLDDLGVPFRVLRKSLFWYATDDPRHVDIPAFYVELPHGHFYGFPKIDERGLKLSEHTGGTEIDEPLDANREAAPDEQARIEGFLAAHAPGASATRTDHEICFYTMTPDEHFLVDRHPRHPQVAFAAGLSGHGFKFASVLGEVLSDLALDGATHHPVAFLGLDRFSEPPAGPASRN